jgi:putative tryptophan/tyrosine transport system substrate-binding protein
MERRGSRLSRRAFVGGAAGLGLMAGCGRWPGQGEPPARVRRVGYLGSTNASHPYVAALQQGLAELGYVEGQNLVIEGRWAEGESARYPALAAELADAGVEVIVVAPHTPAAQAAQHATRTIPIVMTGISDPVAGGLVASLARPGGNVTGLSDMLIGLSGKRLELLKVTVPRASVVAALWNPTNAIAALDLDAMQEAARTLGVTVFPIEVRSADDLPGAFETIAREPVDALIMLADPLLGAVLTPQMPTMVVKSRLPTMHFQRPDVAAGVLMYYGASHPALTRRAAYYVDRILRGTQPADLPVEQPMVFDFVVNLKTARELGITFPEEILLQVTEVIQ